MQQVIVSAEFKQKATKAVGAIVFFALTYLALIALAVGLVILCWYAAIFVVSSLRGLIGILLALGIFGVGLLTMYFLIKFIFTRKKTDLSGFTEITREEEPKLFTLIDDVVQQAGTDFPKKVFLSHDVNASVFYDSSFWSMFLPVRKNLNIGLGLINAVTVDELKGIIAHEFGHFSQRSMKVGSYVYSVNYIIHNMLYDNDSYHKTVSKLASINGWIMLPLLGSVKIVQGIQFILQQVYRIVNVNYLALSREMEFHADEVAAHIAGPRAITTSLARLDLASKSLDAVLNFYGNKIAVNLKPENIYPLHSFVITAIATENDLEFQYGLPVVTPESIQRFNKSKINISHQWASHPSNEDRINRISGLQLQEISLCSDPAVSLLTNNVHTSQSITGKLFSSVEYKAQPTLHLQADFEIEFMSGRENYVLPKKFNNYFDDHDIAFAEVEKFSNSKTELEPESFFANDKTDLVYTGLGLANDINLLDTIQNKDFGIKSFDYENNRYHRRDILMLKPQLQKELESLNKKIKHNDLAILNYYLAKADDRNEREDFLKYYKRHTTFNYWNTEAINLVGKLYESLSFTQQSTPFEQIEVNLKNVSAHELRVKDIINAYVANPDNLPYITAEELNKMEQYSIHELRYFDGKRYYDDSLEILFSALDAFNNSVNNAKFGHKKAFLKFIETL